MFKFFELLFGKILDKKSPSYAAVTLNNGKTSCLECLQLGMKFKPIYSNDKYDIVQECFNCHCSIDHMFIKNRVDNDPEIDYDPCDECGNMFHYTQYICPKCKHDHGLEDGI